jgi:hypothetical protein
MRRFNLGYNFMEFNTDSLGNEKRKREEDRKREREKTIFLCVKQ